MVGACHRRLSAIVLWVAPVPGVQAVSDAPRAKVTGAKIIHDAYEPRAVGWSRGIRGTETATPASVGTRWKSALPSDYRLGELA